ncbi:SAM-dependent methyltransferase [Actinoallomurus bryophytorum]|uniref:S-adenosyl methyltransferase n=1 Tax=Actinoallomurus bryophytorum TaxID=1490222 RepID=A0A543CJ14_9ACTN|nr:SAM-dependent methyltransferase [Actinoallomurus bryophytorum]TQL97094.1 S-adenosyl methyltransferase [Actinoallomurus bryophytorum]
MTLRGVRATADGMDVNQRQTSSPQGNLQVLALRHETGPSATPHTLGIRPPRRPSLDATPSVARVHNYLLGGKDNFLADREFAHRLLELAPSAPAVLRADRDYMRRVVRHLAGTCGIAQFIDIGTGLPDEKNVQQVAHEVNADARVVYVDNDPMVLTHARAILGGDHRVAVVEGDLRTPDGFLQHEATRRLIDFSEPVAVLAIGVLHFLHSDDDPHGIVAHIRDMMAPGSYLAISHLVARPETIRGAQLAHRSLARGFVREKEEIRAFLDGFVLEPPGLASVSRWRPGTAEADERDVWLYAGLGALRPRETTPMSH